MYFVPGRKNVKKPNRLKSMLNKRIKLFPFLLALCFVLVGCGSTATLPTVPLNAAMNRTSEAWKATVAAWEAQILADVTDSGFAGYDDRRKLSRAKAEGMEAQRAISLSVTKDRFDPSWVRSARSDASTQALSARENVRKAERAMRFSRSDDNAANAHAHARTMWSRAISAWDKAVSAWAEVPLLPCSIFSPC